VCEVARVRVTGGRGVTAEQERDRDLAWRLQRPAEREFAVLRPDDPQIVVGKQYLAFRFRSPA